MMILTAIYSILLTSYIYLYFILVPLFALPSSLVLGFRSAFRGFMRLFLRLGFLIFGIQIKVTGLENIPKTGNIILISNHPSLLDPFILNAFLPGDLTFIAPGVTPFGAHAVLTFRGAKLAVKDDGSPLLRAKLLTDIVKRINGREPFVLFPSEGTVEDGSIPHIRSSFYSIFEKTDAAIVPVKITGSIGRRFSMKPALIILKVGKPVSKEALLAGKISFVRSAIASA
jgi:1-acyl-sn-glycerol-3-phosphate acyltransferase